MKRVVRLDEGVIEPVFDVRRAGAPRICLGRYSILFDERQNFLPRFLSSSLVADECCCASTALGAAERMGVAEIEDCLMLMMGDWGCSREVCCDWTAVRVRMRSVGGFSVRGERDDDGGCLPIHLQCEISERAGSWRGKGATYEMCGAVAVVQEDREAAVRISGLQTTTPWFLVKVSRYFLDSSGHKSFHMESSSSLFLPIFSFVVTMRPCQS